MPPNSHSTFYEAPRCDGALGSTERCVIRHLTKQILPISGWSSKSFPPRPGSAPSILPTLTPPQARAGLPQSATPTSWITQLILWSVPPVPQQQLPLKSAQVPLHMRLVPCAEPLWLHKANHSHTSTVTDVVSSRRHTGLDDTMPREKLREPLPQKMDKTLNKCVQEMVLSDWHYLEKRYYGNLIMSL